MITVRDCPFPDHLLYGVKNHVWYERLEDAYETWMAAEDFPGCEPA